MENHANTLKIIQISSLDVVTVPLKHANALCKVLK